MTTAPITISMTLPLIGGSPGGPARGGRRVGGLFRRPWLVISGGANPVAAAQHRPRWMVGLFGPGHVRLMVLFPGVALARLGQFVDHVMQPAMPFRRHL